MRQGDPRPHAVPSSGAPLSRQSGVVLINVLAVIALASSVAYMMISLQETAIHRSQRFSEALLAILLDNPVSARVLVSRRDRQGFLTRENLSSADFLLPPGLGVTSNYFKVTVRINDTTQRLSSLLARRTMDGQIEVVPIARLRGTGTLN